jgi:serine/threonine-protein kinase
MTPENGGGRGERPPRNIAHYAIRDRLGKGAMGVVYRAVDERTRQEVALKVMVSDLEGDQETRARFFREAQIAGQLRHRNVVNVFDSGEANGKLFIAMELLSGCTLTEFLKQEAPELEARIDLMIQVCQGLMVAHDAGIYHRDIKPANLFVCEDRRLKILDFGVARLANSNMTLTGYILGTPDFMSPEQARGDEVDERSDIFSAAAVFYLMLTGRKPFAASDLPAVLNKVLRVDPLPIRDDEAPEVLALVVQKALSKDPMRRQQNVAQLIDELMAAEASIARTSRQAGLTARTQAEEVVRLSTRRRELSGTLELEDPGDAWRAIVNRHPVLLRGPFALGGFPLRFGLVNAIAGELDAALGPLREQVAALETAREAWAEGRDLVLRGNLELAASRFAAARRAVAGSPAITREIELCTRAMDQRREQDVLLQGRLSSAADALGRQEWQTVIAIASDIDRISPGNADAERLRVQASRALEQERSRQARDQQAALERVQRMAEATRFFTEAQRKFDERDLPGAERCAAQSVALNSEDTIARELLDRIRTTIKIQAERVETAKRVAELMAQARRLAEQKKFSKALAALDTALTADVGNAAAADLRARIDAERAADEAAQQAEAARQRRLKAATPAMREARRALASGDPLRARWAAENARAQAPDSPEVQALIDEIMAAAPDVSLDQTSSIDALGSEDTANLAPAQASLQNRAADLKDRASSFLRRFQRGPR